MFLLNERYYETNDFTERAILLNDRFCGTIVNRENVRNRWKTNNNFENERISIFERWKRNKRNV